ncbi:MAG: hypothetical protein QOK04_1328 [Solirubrobacteraceae bacterium]|jgi:hypothetical protein|nr:hypothetical protein [Solirubrobacteraceae bacterium]
MAPDATPTGAALPAGRVRVPEHVVRRGFGSETVMLNLKTGQYHGINATGGRMLDVLEKTGDAAATASQVAADFDVPVATVAADLAELLGALAERGLIAVDG